MNYIYWLSQIQHGEKSLVGNRAYILSQLLQHECSISPGFVLGNNLLRRFLAELSDFKSLVQELSDSSFNLDINDYLAIQSVASRSRQTIARAVFPQDWQRDIFLAAQQLNADALILQPCFFLPSGQDLGGWGLWRSPTCSLHPQAIAETIVKVWSELFSANSLLYWNKLGLSGEKVNLAILVRPLRATYASGMVEMAQNSIVIKAVWGLESSLLQGDVEPDQYFLDRDTGEVLSRSLGYKNYAAQLKEIESKSYLTECITSYIPDQIHTETSVLQQKEIAVLWAKIQQILQKQPQVKYLIWTVPEPKLGNQRNFLLTHFGEQLMVENELSSPSFTQNSPNLLSLPRIKTLLTGISAAPGQAIGSVVIIKNLDERSRPILANSIVVTKNIAPHQISLVKQAQGFITEQGSKTSHAAIVARELKIPAIVNAVKATTVLEDGLEVFLDGEAGTVYPATAANQLDIQPRTKQYLALDRQLIATKLMVNLSQPESLEQILDLPIDGVGLVRSELILGDLLGDRSAGQWRSPSFQQEFTSRLSNYLRQLTATLAPRPIYYRSLDLLALNSPNPILGSRGTYSYHADFSLFSLELEVLMTLIKEGYHNLNLILPFVRGVEEFKFCYRQLQNIGLVDRESFQVWIMAEVPSVIWLLPEYVRAGVRGIAIGTNDLTQLILGVDRQQENFNTQGLNANHPAVHQALAQLITTAKEQKIDCCICGQAPVEFPSLIEKLIQWGVTSISVEPTAVQATYQAIARAEKHILLESLKQNQK